MTDFDITKINAELESIEGDIAAARANPARSARIDQYSREIDLVLALSALRDALGLSQEAFAFEAGMSQENLSRIERQLDVKFSTIERLAKAGKAKLELSAVLENGDRVLLMKSNGAAAPGRSKKDQIAAMLGGQRPGGPRPVPLRAYMAPGEVISHSAMKAVPTARSASASKGAPSMKVGKAASARTKPVHKG